MKSPFLLFICLLFLNAMSVAATQVRIKSEIDGLSVKVLNNEENNFLFQIKNTTDSAVSFAFVAPYFSEYNVDFVSYTNQHQADTTFHYFWGMPVQLRRLATLFPLEVYHFNAHEVRHIRISAQQILRKNGKPYFEIQSVKSIENASFYRKLFDALMAAFLLINFLFLIKWRNNSETYIKFYILYSIFTLLYFFSRFFILHFNEFVVPLKINFFSEIIGFLAGLSYYFFGINYLVRDNQKRLKNIQLITAILGIIYLIHFLPINEIYKPLFLKSRILILLYLFVSLLIINIYYFQKFYAKVFLALFLPYIGIVLLNVLQTNFINFVGISKNLPLISLGMGVIDMTVWLFLLSSNFNDKNRWNK
jgi:hypothetical protein